MKNRFLTALTAGLCAFVLVGCQPSGDDAPSQEQTNKLIELYYDMQRLESNSHDILMFYPRTCYIDGSEDVIAYVEKVVNRSLISYWDGQLQNLPQKDKAFIEAAAWQEDLLATFKTQLNQYEAIYADVSAAHDVFLDLDENYTYAEIENLLNHAYKAMEKHQKLYNEFATCQPYHDIVRAAIDLYKAQNTLQ